MNPFHCLFDQVLSPQTLLIESSAGSKTLRQATVTVRNTGSTVLFFSWSRVPRGETIVSVNGALAAAGEGGSDREGGSVRNNTPGEAAAQTRSLPERGLSTGRKAANDAARHAALQSPEHRFFCVQVKPRLAERNRNASKLSGKLNLENRLDEGPCPSLTLVTRTHRTKPGTKGESF